MSYNSKKAITDMVAGALLIIAYIIYARGNTALVPNDLKACATVMLVFIGISIGVMIVIQILFRIALAIGIAIKEREQDDKTVERIISSTMLEDERDKIIELKSAHVGFICAGIGFVLALVSLVAGAVPLTALHIVFGSFFVGSLIEGGVSIYHYERGVRNG
jgi:hypothetical protein